MSKPGTITRYLGLYWVAYCDLILYLWSIFRRNVKICWWLYVLNNLVITAKLASNATSSSSLSSSNTYLLLVPTVAPSNLEQSKRQVVGNLISSQKSSHQFVELLDEEEEKQNVLKRKVPTGVVSSSEGCKQTNCRQTSTSSNASRLKPAQQASVKVTNISIRPASSNPSSSTQQMEMLEKSLSQLVSSDQNVSAYPTLSKQQGTVSNQHGVSIPITQSVHQQQQNNDQGKANIDMVAWGKSDEQALVKDFDANLSGLGLELGAGAYNMSEVLNLPMFKQEDTIVSGNNNQNLPPLQYMLCAPTSPATKIHEETLTYLNQGHPYEIRLKKLGELPADTNQLRLVKSFLKVVFHDRRLQYTEHQQLEGWRFSRPGDRLVNIDVPMSVGILDPKEPPNMLNLVEFTWDLDKHSSIYIQVHCISTEFTPKKHGGERGVPFRIQIDTYQLNGNGDLSQHLHSASCQIKVFKPKGADRKQKTDKDKMVKRSVQEKLKYQPSYDSTLLTECIPTPLHFLQDALELNSNEQKRPSYSESPLDQTVNVDINSPSTFLMEDIAVSPGVSTTSGNYARIMETSTVNQQHSIMSQNCTSSGIEPLTPSSTTSQTTQWLQKNRFSSFTKTFASFTGADMLSLNRDDLIQICGSAEGIRLYNSLRSRKIQPRLTLYMSPAVPENEGQIHVYRAFYFEKLTASELIREASSLFEQQNGGGRPHITRALYQPTKSNIHVLVTDELVSTLRDEQCFTVIVIKNEVGDGYQIILKQ